MSRLILIGLLLLLAVTPVYAQNEERDPAAAQALFDEALSLRDEDKLDEACNKFAESQRLDPQLGTLLNLADCYARAGKTASAWAAFIALEGEARKAGDQRADLAKKRADELKPKLSSMRIEVVSRVDGLEIKRDDGVVGEAQWGTSVPVDPGSHLIRASARGYKTWEQTVSVEDGGNEVEVRVPRLEKKPGGEHKTLLTPNVDDATARQGQLVAGIVFAGLGGVGLGVAGALQIVAKMRDDESLDFCQPDDPNSCDATGQDLRDEARRLQTGAIITVVAGGAMAVTGAILLLTLPSEDDTDNGARVQVLPEFGPGYAGVGVTARW